ncbi:MAG: SDR family NAD(P)-dependent oxidoreductase [Polyangiaceae bacterium]|nr:SDR family NAD(P)-dependent oxidoreductase [Myxococcales bacterium]MCB9587007.1 SDR family NAD(P)-dependent oxidoreductase [Polyangiaceae bacterium]
MSERTIVLSGASSGIGAALAVALAAPGRRLVLTARRRDALEATCELVRRAGAEAEVVTGDLSTRQGARQLAERIREAMPAIDLLIHNAGIWPTKRELTMEGFERGFAVNYVGTRELNESLLPSLRGTLDRPPRVVFVSAGLLKVMGRWDKQRTPKGTDFSRVKTYANTKLCGAIYARQFALEHPELEVMLLHPGVVRTELGVGEGLMGRATRWMKRRWETPEACASRAARVILEQPVPRGEGVWILEDKPDAWPKKFLQPAHAEELEAVLHQG